MVIEDMVPFLGRSAQIDIDDFPTVLRNGRSKVFYESLEPVDLYEKEPFVDYQRVFSDCIELCSVWS